MLSDLTAIIDLPFIGVIFLGAVSGLFVGSMPGLSVTMATALLVSITYTWDTNLAMGLIMGVYVVGVYSGAITAILINIPGAPSSVSTTLDGYPMAKKGQALLALRTATIYSFMGSVIGLVILMISAGPVTKLALKFTRFDYFLLALFGLTTIGSLTSKSYVKGLLSAALGVFLSTVGMDSMFGIGRFTFGVTNLQRGIPIVAALIGLFGFSEILMQVSKKKAESKRLAITDEKVSTAGILKHWFLGVYSSILGALIGALPGAGGPVAALIAYDQAKKVTKSPKVPFGEGAIEGIVASEAANNGCIGGALIPMLTLAVPGDAVTAVILSAFYIHGLRPGPLLFSQTPEMFSVILAAGFIACLMILVLGYTVAPLLSKVATIKEQHLFPIVATLCVVGAFATSNNFFDVWLMIGFGVLGFVLRKREYSVAPLVLGLVLGGLMDDNFRRTMSLLQSSDSPIQDLFFSPISMVLTLLIVFSVLSNFISFSGLLSGKRSKKHVSEENCEV